MRGRTLAWGKYSVSKSGAHRAAGGTRTRVKQWIAGTAVAALAAGALVVAGLGLQSAAAAGPAPTVTATIPEPYVAGEDVAVQVTFTSAGAAAGDQFNLSLGVVLPEGVTVVDTGTLGRAVSYPTDPANRIIPGVYATLPGTCATLGLEPANPMPPAPGDNACQVPLGKQYVVFQNISDLPQGASTTHTLTLRPNAAAFPVGATDLDLSLTAYTSGDERFIPVFPGTRGVAVDDDHTSDPGISALNIPVNALRVQKSEPSDEDQLLRGVHDNSTTYTLRVFHTGEGDITGTTVVDFLPAGLEYLGLGGVDNTANANGTRGEASEYPGAPSLAATPAPSPAAGAWQQGLTETVETVIPTAQEVADYGLEAGKVYTKVTWNLDTLLATADPRGSASGVQQVYADTPGSPGLIEIRYRAGVPLFENTLDFGPDGAPAIDGAQTANLDNNRGASTRHGHPQDENGEAPGKSYRNVAVASGSYAGSTVASAGSHEVEAVDLRVVKSVDDGSFHQAGVARYTLGLARSEYTTATVPGPGTAPHGIVDDLADGLCPVFPAGTLVADGASPHAGTPNLVILGDAADPRVGDQQAAADWNAVLAALGVNTDCLWDPSTPPADPSLDLVGAEVVSIAFDLQTAHFLVDFAPAPADALVTDTRHEISYSVRQNETYLGQSSHGMTTSGDTIANSVRIAGLTQSIDALDGVESAGSTHPDNTVAPDVADGVWNASDTSSETLVAGLTQLTKHVLQRDTAVDPEPGAIVTAPESAWTKSATDPFAIGDEIWYRIVIDPPSGADVRNPKFTDFLPLGVEFDPTDDDGNGIPDDMWIVVPETAGSLGSCAPADNVAWVNTFVLDTPLDITDNTLTFTLGNNCGLGGDDRFLPLDTSLTIYLKATIVDQAAFGTADLSENLAKYQQNNVDGEVFFLRDAAEVQLAQSLRLLKGIRSVGGTTVSDGDVWNGDVDHRQVVQGDEVVYRLDLTAPQVASTDYTIWDALPQGIKRADVAGADPLTGVISAPSATAATVTGADAVETPLASGWTATVYDFGDPDYPADVRADIAAAERSIIVWTISATVPRSLPPVAAGTGPTTPAVPAIAQGLTLGYTVVIPDGTEAGGGPAAVLTQEYVNDSSVVRYASVSNGAGDNPVIVPEGPGALSTRPADLDAGEHAIGDELTFDPSDVFLPGASMAKRLVSTEIRPTGSTPADPFNTSQPTAPLAERPDDVIVEGEYATFEYAFTIPAHTSVPDLRLSDGGSFAFGSNQSIAYEVLPGSAQFFAFDNGTDVPSVCGEDALAGFTCEETDGDEHGVLAFAGVYTNTTDDDQTFRVRLTVRVDTNDGAVAGLGTGTDLVNTATFGYRQPNGEPDDRTEMTATASVQYREPGLTIAKSASPSTGVSVGSPIAYTLTISNDTNRVKSYDNVVVDTVPEGLRVVTGPLAAAGATFAPSESALQNGEGGTITWSFEQFSDLAEIPTTATLGYTATIDPATGAGRAYTNEVEVIGHTLPGTLPGAETRRGERGDDGEATVTAVTASIDKGVRVRPATGDPAYTPTASAPIGETVQYRVGVTLNPNINYYDVRVRDALPAGVTMVAGTERVHLTTGGGSPVDVTADWTHTSSGQTHTWVYGDSDLLAATETRTLTLTYDVLLAPTVAQGVLTLTNTADFTWALTDGGELRPPIADTATVNVQNPLLGVVKDVRFNDAQGVGAWGQRATGNPDRGFEYRVRVTNTGAVAAFHTDVTDTVPAGVVVDPTTISHGGVLTGADPVTGGGTITWSDLADPIAVGAGNALDLTYRAEFAPSANLTANASHQGAVLTNTARVTHYESFPRDPAAPDTPTGREFDPMTVSDTAEARALFPYVTLTKAAADTSRTAYVGEPFQWVLTATNSGAGAAQTVVLTDVLPENWTFTAVQEITIAGVSAPATAPTGPAGGPLVWSFGSAAVDGAPAAVLQPGQSIVVRYTATPVNPDALTAPGVGDANPHTNTLSATTTDRTGATANQTRSHTGPNASDNAFLREANLRLQKDGVGGVADPALFGGLAEGSWIAGQGVATGYAQPQWRITVTNQGPNAGFGPFTITDTMPPLPDGVSVGSWSARYYSSSADLVGTDLGTFTGSGPFTVGTATTSLRADGVDRIELVANVTIAEHAVAAAAPDALSLSNTASVTGRTYENPSNLPDNTDSDTKPVQQLADLVIAKDVSSPVPPAAPVVGSEIAWQITVRNAGPSASLSSDANPITITDEVPAGVTGVTASSNGDWVATLADGSAIPAEGVGAGTVIMWTYQGPSMPVGATASVSLAGTILTSHTGELTNTATVHPGDTPDPVQPNNTDPATVTPNDTTTLGITKSRVVPDGAGGWRQVTADPADAFVAGDPVHYRITVTNHGPADARAVTVVDETPAGLAYLTHEDQAVWAYAPGGTTSAYPGGAPLGREFGTFTLDGTLTAGASNASSFVVTYDTETTITGDVVNEAEVTAENWDPTDPTGPYDRDDVSTGSTRIVDLGIVKSHTGDGPFTPGTEVEYTLVVTNHGPSATNGAIEIVDSLPAGLSYVADSATVTVPAGTTAPAGPNPSVGGQGDRALTWSLLAADDTFDLDQTITITFRALIDPTVRESATLANAATVDGPDAEPDPDPNPNRDEDAITTGPTEATMTIEKVVASSTPFLAGTTVSYTLTIENEGPSAVPATVIDELPEGLTIVSMSGAGWDCSGVVPGSTAGICEYLDLADDNPVTRVLHPLGTSTISVVATIAPGVPTGTELVNEAVLGWTDGRGTNTDDDDAEITVTTDADLGIVKSVISGADGDVVSEPAPATAGETVWYRLQVTNHGPSDAIGPITVTDVLPLGVTVPASLTSVGPWEVAAGPVDPVLGQTVTFTLSGGQLAAIASDSARGVAPVVEFEAQLDPSIVDGALLTNDASVTSPTPDSNPTNDSDDAVIEVGRSADLAIAKSHPVDDAGQVRIDEPLDFTIAVTNHGPSIATGITVTDTVPAGLEVTSEVGPIDGTGWTLVSVDLVDPEDPLGGTVVVASYAPPLGVIAPENEADPLVISTIVRESALGTDPNHASVVGEEFDPDLENNEALDPLDVRPRVTLVVEKTALGEFQVGKTGSYRIVVSNSGPHADPGPITVTDELPAGLSYHSSPSLPDGVELEVAGQTVMWTLPAGLAVDDSVTLTLTVNVQQAAFPSVTNVVTIDSPAEKTPESVLADDETVEVRAADPLEDTGSAPVAVMALLAALLLLAGGAVSAVRRRDPAG